MLKSKIVKNSAGEISFSLFATLRQNFDIHQMYVIGVGLSADVHQMEHNTEQEVEVRTARGVGEFVRLSVKVRADEHGQFFIVDVWSRNEMAAPHQHRMPDTIAWVAPQVQQTLQRVLGISLIPNTELLHRNQDYRQLLREIERDEQIRALAYHLSEGATIERAVQLVIPTSSARPRKMNGFQKQKRPSKPQQSRKHSANPQRRSSAPIAQRPFAQALAAV